jgi:galactokinase
MKSFRETFKDQFGHDPSFMVQAPGRVNLIGEHTDYNDGFVFPVAIDKRLIMSVSPRQDQEVLLYSSNLDSKTGFNLESISKDDSDSWSNYPRGIAYLLKKEGYRLRGLEAVITSDVPIGAGLSSSAAFELASAWAFLMASNPDVSGLKTSGRRGSENLVRPSPSPPSPLEIIRIARQSENEFVGLACGVMDQFISALGQRHHALFLDCRTLAYQQVPLPDSVKIVVCDTGVKRELAGSEYNKRRSECELGVQFLKARVKGISALRDISLRDFEAISGSMDPLIRKRCRHVVSENERVIQSVDCLKSGQLEQFGKLMNASHQSLKADYEVSCKELDVMVEIAGQQPGTVGARMTGAGFGGCTVNLIRKESVETFCQRVKDKYQQETGIAAHIYVCNSSDGAGLYQPSEP